MKSAKKIVAIIIATAEAEQQITTVVQIAKRSTSPKTAIILCFNSPKLIKKLFL